MRLSGSAPTPQRRSAAENGSLHGSAYIPGLTTAQLGECVWESVCACERERVKMRESERPSCLLCLTHFLLLSLSLFALPRTSSPPSSLASIPFLLYTFSLSSLLCLSLVSFLLLPLLHSPLSLSPPPPPSFSSRASLLAVDVTEAEAEATLPPLAAIHKLAIKKTEAKKRRKAEEK